LKIPLIGINTLELMALTLEDDVELVCPVIDARRMEVFMALYTKEMQELIKPCAKIIDTNTFDEWLNNRRVGFTGNGVNKLQNLIVHPNAVFNNKSVTAADMLSISQRQYDANLFADTAYIEPFYVKEFYSNTKEK
jgi:tRNA threonylcarbamoyladenosine biosynthesis protein TsaB